MSPIDQVLAAAKAIALNGHVPNLALVKSRLHNKLPIPTIIQGLKAFKAMPKEHWESLEDLDVSQTEENAPQASSADIDLQQLVLTIKELTQQIERLTARVNLLENKVTE